MPCFHWLFILFKATITQSLVQIIFRLSRCMNKSSAYKSFDKWINHLGDQQKRFPDISMYLHKLWYQAMIKLLSSWRWETVVSFVFCCTEDSPFLQFTIHLHSKVDCDDSIKLNSFFLVLEGDSIPNSKLYLHGGQRFKYDSYTAGKNGADSTHEIHTHFLNSFMTSICKVLQIHPRCTFVSSPLTLFS